MAASEPGACELTLTFLDRESGTFNVHSSQTSECIREENSIGKGRGSETRWCETGSGVGVIRKTGPVAQPG